MHAKPSFPEHSIEAAAQLPNIADAYQNVARILLWAENGESEGVLEAPQMSHINV